MINHKKPIKTLYDLQLITKMSSFSDLHFVGPIYNLNQSEPAIKSGFFLKINKIYNQILLIETLKLTMNQTMNHNNRHDQRLIDIGFHS